MVIVEHGIKSEGLLEKGFDWYVQWIDVNQGALTSAEFQGVFSSWKSQVLAKKRRKVVPEDLTIGDLVGSMKPAHLWGSVGAIATLIGVLVTLGIQLLGKAPRLPAHPRHQRPAQPQSSMTPTAEPQARRFVVALSFPGEHRTYVRTIAKCLANALGDNEKVFFDEWYDPELLGADSDQRLRQIYGKESEIIVPFFSRHYEKPWCQLEWGMIRGILLECRRENRIVPVHLDDTAIDGWGVTDRGIDKGRQTAAQIAERIIAFHRDSRRQRTGARGDRSGEETVVGLVGKEREAAVRKRDAVGQEKVSQMSPKERIVCDRRFGTRTFVVINDDICTSRADIVVSSDDNYFSAQGGVSKALLSNLGKSVRGELDRYIKSGFRQGQVAVTTGGAWKRLGESGARASGSFLETPRAIVHAAVMDKDELRYPNPDAIRTVTRRSLNCAAALSARSIAFPVLGGGYGREHMSATECVNVIATEIIAFMKEARDHGELERIWLYIFNPDDNKGLPAEISIGNGA